MFIDVCHGSKVLGTGGLMRENRQDSMIQISEHKLCMEILHILQHAVYPLRSGKITTAQDSCLHDDRGAVGMMA